MDEHKNELEVKKREMTVQEYKGTPMAYWDCVLTREEILALYEGISPALIRPDKLLFYTSNWNADIPEGK